MFGLFESPDLSAFRAFPRPVQDDLVGLLLLDSLARGSIERELVRLSHDSNTDLLPQGMLSDAVLVGELQICLLSTAAGKPLDQVAWNSLVPERAIHCLGGLAMTEFRNLDKPEGDLDLSLSGYSADPDEARTQFLVLSAIRMGVTDIGGSIRLSEGTFLESWLQLRNALLELKPRRIGKSASTVSVKETKSLFKSLSPARRQLLLEFGEGLAKQQRLGDKTGEAVRDNTPFDSERSKREHPLLYVPFPSVVALMDQVASAIRDTVSKFPLDDYELRRLTGIKGSLPSRVIVQVMEADVRALAYALVTAAAGEKEKKFIGCGVWKKITEVFQKRGTGDFQAMAEVQATGLLGKPGPGRDFSLAANQLEACRGAATEFLRAASSDRQARLHLLFTGTAILRHVLNHPGLGPPLASTALHILQALDASMTELTRGELLDWDHQKDLPVL